MIWMIELDFQLARAIVQANGTAAIHADQHLLEVPVRVSPPAYIPFCVENIIDSPDFKWNVPELLKGDQRSPLITTYFKFEYVYIFHIL